MQLRESLNRGISVSNWTSTANLNDIINNLDQEQLQELCSSYYNNTNGTSTTSATAAVNDDNDYISNFYACELLNLIQCYGCQFVRLILLLIFLYAWNNQMTNSYLMNSNCQLTDAISDLLQDCIDNNCNSCNNSRSRSKN